MPDGLVVDDEGGVWLALYGGAQVRRYSPDGELTEKLDVPADNVTAVLVRRRPPVHHHRPLAATAGRQPVRRRAGRVRTACAGIRRNMITGATARDIRFPTSQGLHGSDAMTPDPDYSAAYVTLTTDDGLEGHGFTFTEGRGNELCVAAIEALAKRVDGLDLDEVRADPGEVFRRVTGDPQLRWLGPEKGVIHLATAAVVNAVWDMWARAEGKPLWALVADFTPEQFVSAVPVPVPDRRDRPGLGARAARGASDRQGRAPRRDASATASPPTRPRPAGSATPRTRSAGSPARRSRRAGTT